ncbi:phage integrase central domain-containing protein [Pseudomonas shahriarae]|uniref:phage integrase central domain-containing protein n=2 Tax=Pseudomonas TaxID=286 RepID=UPI003CE48194
MPPRRKQPLSKRSHSATSSITNQAGKIPSMHSNGRTPYAFAEIGKLPTQEIGTQHVLKILKPIWTVIPETASRVRNRIERVVDAVKAVGLREGENPARWGQTAASSRRSTCSEAPCSIGMDRASRLHEDPRKSRSAQR